MAELIDLSALNTITEASMSCAVIHSMISRPEMSGSFRSRMTRSVCPSLSLAIASWPVLASQIERSSPASNSL